MMKALLAALFLVAVPLFAAEPGKLTIEAEPLGDAPDGIVVKMVFRYGIGPDVPPGVPLVIVGSVTQNGVVTKRLRFPLLESQRESFTTIQTLQTGDAEVEARLMVPLEESAPVIVAKSSQKFTIAKTNKTYVAGEGASAEAVVAEGLMAETAGAVKIVAPRRDIAVNLFIVDVDVQPPVKRVEFWVEGKKVMAKNAPPYRAELDLGSLPKRVEVRAVGYDERGRYVDADAFVVNERETPLEVKITRTITPDSVSHFKLSVQNPHGNAIKSVVLYAGKNKLYEWTQPPYAIAVSPAKLKGVDFVRASVLDSTNYEASDLLFLNGERYTEEIEVNVIELPVSVIDVASGAPVKDLKQSDFSVSENGKPQAITSFNFAQNLPIAVGLLVDHSGSMAKRMEATKKAANDFLQKIMRSGDRAFVGGFAFDPQKIAPFVSDSGTLAAQVEAIPKAEGGTALYDAIVTGLYRFRGLQGRKALVILTDGEDTTSRVTYEDMLNYARAARVPLYFIGIGISQIPGLGGGGVMKSLAAETGGTAYFIHNEKQLGEAYAELEKELRSQYFIAYRTESTKKDRGYRSVVVTVDKPGAVVRTIRGYIP